MDKIPDWVKSWAWKIIVWAVAVGLGALGASYFGIPKTDPGPFPLPVEQAEKEPDQEQLYFCGRTESIRDSLAAKPWPVRRITWTVDTSASPLPADQVIEAFKVAWGSWAAGIDIEPVYVSTPDIAMVRSKFGDYDGSGKVLAWSELADGTVTAKHQLYDRAERWEVSSNPKNVDLVRVAAHEIGHVLGLYHDDGGGRALMDPFYSRTIRFPTQQDITRARTLGYAAARQPPVPEPTPNVNITIPVTIGAQDIIDALQKAGYKVTK